MIKMLILTSWQYQPNMTGPLILIFLLILFAFAWWFFVWRFVFEYIGKKIDEGKHPFLFPPSAWWSDYKRVKEEKERYRQLDLEGKQKYKKEKRKTLGLSVIVSLIITIILLVIGCYDDDFEQAFYIISLLIGFSGLLVVFSLLAYLVIDDHERRKGKYF